MAATVTPEAFAPNLSLRWLADGDAERHRSVDGALLFLDISGFTALSEALTSLGRVGSEEVRDVINATFTAILELAYDQGGSLLKFGGDAVLLLFEGDDAAARAAVAARRMLDRLLTRNPVHTSGGGVTLGATVGVHAGPVDLFLVGHRHHELLVLGPTASETIRIESTAERDEVLVSDAVAAQLDAAVLGGCRVGARVLVGVPEEVPGWGAVRRLEREIDAWQLVPERLRTPLREGRIVGQHRRATVAFVKVAGTDELLAVGGSGALADELDRIVRTAQDACAEFDVTWLSSDVDDGGCKIILVAGVPAGDDDDNDRIVHAARRLAAASGRLHIRIGVHRGPLFSGVVGPSHRMTYTVLGDAVNLAARTMGHARSGQVLATVGVLNGTRTLYDITLLEPFHVKGKTQPVRAGVVGRELGVRVRGRSSEIEFVGRVDELAALIDLVDRAGRSGVGNAVQLQGPAGIGKSRLVDELEDVRPHVPMHLVACTRFSVDRPYGTIALLLRLALTGERHGPGEDVLAAAGDVLGDGPSSALLPLLGMLYEVVVPETPETADLDPANVPGRIRDLIGELLLAAVPAHAIVVVEDVQWLDSETRQMLEDAIERLLPRRGWTLVLTARDPIEVHPDVVALPLPALSDDEAMSLALAFVDGGSVPFEVAPRLVERAGGNALYLAELARAASSGEMPDDVESLVRQRLDRLPPAHLRLVQHAAVLGIEFPPDLLDAVVADDERAAGASVADVPELLATMQSGYVRFRQSLYQEGAYEALPFRERQELHRRAAAALERLDVEGRVAIAVEARSRHHHLAGDAAGSWRWSREALDGAIDRWALGTAVSFARRALDAGSRLRIPPEERAAVWEQLGDVLGATGSFTGARAAYQRARRLARPSPRLARKAGYVREQQGEYAQAMRWYRIGANESRALGDDAEYLALEARRAKALLRRGRPSEALALARDLLAEGERVGAPSTLGHLHHVHAWAGTLLGTDDVDEHLAAAQRCFERAGDLPGQTFILNDVGATAYWRGDWDRAIEAYSRNREVLERLGDVAHAAATDGNIGEVLADQGQLDAAVGRIEAALRRLEIAGHTNLYMIIEQFLGRALGRRGEFERAHAVYVHNAGLARQHGAHALLRDAHVRRAELAIFAGDLRLFEEQVAAASSVEGAEPSPPTEAVLARLHGIASWAQDAHDEARARFATSVDVARAAGLRYEAGLAHVARAQLYGPDDASRRAVEELRSMGVVEPIAVLAIGPRLAAEALDSARPQRRATVTGRRSAGSGRPSHAIGGS